MSNHHKFKDSSSIEHCDYDDEKGHMEIKFTSGAVYHYPECSKAHYEAFKQAESAGKHYHTHLRRLKAIKVE